MQLNRLLGKTKIVEFYTLRSASQIFSIFRLNHSIQFYILLFSIGADNWKKAVFGRKLLRICYKLKD